MATEARAVGKRPVRMLLECCLALNKILASIGFLFQTPVVHALGVVLQDPEIWPDPTK